MLRKWFVLLLLCHPTLPRSGMINTGFSEPLVLCHSEGNKIHFRRWLEDSREHYYPEVCTRGWPRLKDSLSFNSLDTLGSGGSGWPMLLVRKPRLGEAKWLQRHRLRKHPAPRGANSWLCLHRLPYALVALPLSHDQLPNDLQSPYFVICLLHEMCLSRWQPISPPLSGLWEGHWKPKS